MVLRKHAIYIVTIHGARAEIARKGGRSLIEDIVDPKKLFEERASFEGKYIYIYIFGNHHLYQLLRRDYYTRSRLEATSKNISLLPRYLVHYYLFPSLFIHRTCFTKGRKKKKKKEKLHHYQFNDIRSCHQMRRMKL